MIWSFSRVNILKYVHMFCQMSDVRPNYIIVTPVHCCTVGEGESSGLMGENNRHALKKEEGDNDARVNDR